MLYIEPKEEEILGLFFAVGKFDLEVLRKEIYATKRQNGTLSLMYQS